MGLGDGHEIHFVLSEIHCSCALNSPSNAPYHIASHRIAPQRIILTPEYSMCVHVCRVVHVIDIVSHILFSYPLSPLPNSLSLTSAHTAVDKSHHQLQSFCEFYLQNSFTCRHTINTITKSIFETVLYVRYVGRRYGILEGNWACLAERSFLHFPASWALLSY